MNVDCPSGRSVLSCGNKNTQLQNREFYRSTKPLSATTCQCYDKFGVECSAWCTSCPVRNFEISKVTSSGSYKAFCPSGKKVLGCYLSPLLDKSYEVFPATFPSDGGSSCTCYHWFGAECLAICASNVDNYEINAESGKGFVISGCKKPGNTVLGCSAANGGNPSAEEFPTARVSGSSSCECYNRFSVTCFAVCGQLTSKLTSTKIN